MVGRRLVLVVNNQSFATNAVQIITCVWNQVIEPDNLRSWQSKIEVHFSGKRTILNLSYGFRDKNWLLTLAVFTHAF